MKRLLICISILLFAQLPSMSQQLAESILETISIATKKRTVVMKKPLHFEAPNWSTDGKFFIINSNGKLYRVNRANPEMLLINTDFADRCNNDHGISPDGKQIVISHTNIHDTSQPVEWKRSTIYVLPIDGGTPKRVTPNVPSFWHGWSPDGKELAYCAERNGNFDVYTIPVEGGQERRLTDDAGLDDGPEYGHDGQWIYYNSFQSGSMQIWRMHTDGSSKEQLTNDKHSNWFAHPSPDGKWIVFITYLEDQKQAHPFGKDVKLRLMSLADRKITDLTEVFYGGQGTINVPSWSPDSKEIAFVSYKKK